jgi:hypothetical protein
MTGVIEHRAPTALEWRAMRVTTPDSALEAAVRQHRALLSSAADTRPDDVGAVLDLGVAVSELGRLERDCVFGAARYVSAAVIESLVAEHVELAEHLACLDELRHAEPQSDDLAVMCEAMLRRLREHLERDERVLYLPLQHLDLMRGSPSPDPSI